jgi:hypothetical protein
MRSGDYGRQPHVEAIQGRNHRCDARAHTASLYRVRRLCIQAQRSVNLSLHICNLPVTGLDVVFWYDKIGIGEFISTGGMTCLSIDKR